MHKLAEIAKEKGVDLVRLAWQAKVRTDDLRAIIHGQTELPEIWAHRFAGILGVPVSELMEPEVQTLTVEDGTEEAEDIIYLEDLTVKELREIARSKGLTGYVSMRKPKLIDALAELCEPKE